MLLIVEDNELIKENNIIQYNAINKIQYNAR